MDQYLKNELLFLPEGHIQIIPMHFGGENLKQSNFAFPLSPLNSLLQHAGSPTTQLRAARQTFAERAAPLHTSTVMLFDVSFHL